MSKRTVDPKKITTLRDWSARWPGAGNLGFDPETREPAVFSADKERKQVSKIPWVREGDTLTILAQPTRFSAKAVEAASTRYGKFREQRKAYSVAAADQLRMAEAALLEAWRVYHAAPPAGRAGLRRDIFTAEKAVTELEAALAEQIYKGRSGVEYSEYLYGLYVPPMPLERRGITMTAVGGGAAAAAEEASSE
jgi:hypothetical protein